jgi:murein L,D-transpeptidase YafK
VRYNKREEDGRYFTLVLVGLALIIAIPKPGLQASAFALDNNPLYPYKIPDSILIDSIAVHKAKRELMVFTNNQLIKVYRIHLGKNPVGPKQMNGDFKTPEGLYYITHRNPQSLFYKSLGISYPNTEDMARARRMGQSAGGGIVIHGLPNRDRYVGLDRYQNDWTWGCIGMRNEEIDELFNRVAPGTPIMITP